MGAANPPQALVPFAGMGGVADTQAASIHGQEASEGDARPRRVHGVGINHRAAPGQGCAPSPEDDRIIDDAFYLEMLSRADALQPDD